VAEALLKLMNAKNEIQIIGTRHGEKLYETLLNREEMAQAEDLGDYYRVPADTRDLNYSNFFNKGKTEVSEAIDYNSHNTKLLDVEEMMAMLLQLRCVQDAMNGKTVLV
jgi:UDP-glucose 4-epimerase